MATMFLSYQHDDESLARALGLRLAARRHSFRYQPGVKIAGDWRGKFQQALADAEAVVFLLTESGLLSRYVLGQIGSSRVYAETKGQMMIPVLVKRNQIPDFVSDLTCFQLGGREDQDLDRLTEDIDHAIKGHRSGPQDPRIFISHRHKDAAVAAALVSLIEASFDTDKADIRCTSVQPYALPPGAQVSERLRKDVNRAQLVIGLIGPETSESRYVLFELGASWGRGVGTFPLLIRGASPEDVPGPLRERLSISLQDEDNCLQLIDDIAEGTSLQRKQGVGGRVAGVAKALAKLASKGDERRQAPAKGVRKPVAKKEHKFGVFSNLELERMAQHIVNYLKARSYTMVSFERVRENINAGYSDAMMLNLIEQSPSRFRRAKLKGGKPGIALV